MNKKNVHVLPAAWKRIGKVFIALGDAHRQKIVLLFERGERLNVSEIVAVSTLSRSAVTHHLKVLREAGVLKSIKHGKEVYFWVNPAAVQDALHRVLAYIDETHT